MRDMESGCARLPRSPRARALPTSEDIEFPQNIAKLVMHAGPVLSELAADLLRRHGTATQPRTERVHVSVDFVVELDDPARSVVHGRLGAAGRLQRLETEGELGGVDGLGLLHLVHGGAGGTAPVGELGVALLISALL